MLTGDDALQALEFGLELAAKYETPDPKAGAGVALAVIFQYAGSCDGDHHKAWLIDQVVRALTGGSYEAAIAEWQDGEDGPDTYEWETGIPP